MSSSPQTSPTAVLKDRQPNSMKSEVAMSPPMKDAAMYPWNWGEEAGRIQLSPAATKQSLRRGRPRADSITGLILKGSSSPSDIKCHICNRVFPRDKSLQAHLRTHTGERPYQCDFPGCQRAFTQSGQLKTHQRLHTGEKPFICSAHGCRSSFAHANRHCPDHPFATLQRAQDLTLDKKIATDESNREVVQWLERYHRAKVQKVPGKLRERKLKRELDEQAYLDNLNSAKRACGILETENQVESFSSSRQDELLGALALIQLAETREISQPLNLTYQK